MKNLSTSRLFFYNEVIDGKGQWPGKCSQVPEGLANLVGSLCDDGSHLPVIDIDLPCKLIPSTTKDHYHLYIDKSMSYSQYLNLIKVLVECGIVEPGWLQHMERNGMTTVRVPGHKKPENRPSY